MVCLLGSVWGERMASGLHRCLRYMIIRSCERKIISALVVWQDGCGSRGENRYSGASPGRLRPGSVCGIGPECSHIGALMRLAQRVVIACNHPQRCCRHTGRFRSRAAEAAHATVRCSVASLLDEIPTAEPSRRRSGPLACGVGLGLRHCVLRAALLASEQPRHDNINICPEVRLNQH